MRELPTWVVIENMIMKPTIALLPDNLREALNRRTAGGRLPDPLRAEPKRPWAFRVPQGHAYANPHEASASACSTSSAARFPPFLGRISNLKFQVPEILTYYDLL
jgi:hypothetical protein